MVLAGHLVSNCMLLYHLYLLHELFLPYIDFDLANHNEVAWMVNELDQPLQLMPRLYIFHCLYIVNQYIH